MTGQGSWNLKKMKPETIKAQKEEPLKI